MGSDQGNKIQCKEMSTGVKGSAKGKSTKKPGLNNILENGRITKAGEEKHLRVLVPNNLSPANHINLDASKTNKVLTNGT